MVATRRGPAIEAGLVATAGLLALALRAPLLDRRYWFDELQTLAIAERPIARIPAALRHDGSPPLYPLLLHGWIRAFGNTETATHSLSIALSLATVVVAWWVTRRIAGPTAGVIAAFAVSTNPFLAYYATETRNYALFALVGLVAVGLGHVVLTVPGRGRVVGLGVVVAAVAYTHSWAAFFVPALFAALLVAARRDAAARRRVGAAFVVGGALVVPWLPVALDQARHTGAPWLPSVGLEEAGRSLANFFGGPREALLFLLATSGAAAMARAHRRIDTMSAPLVGACALTLALGWATSVLRAPMWLPRYAIVVLPCLLVAAAVLASRTRGGVVLLVVALVPAGFQSVRQAANAGPWSKSRVVAMAETVGRARPTQVFATESDLVAISRYAGTPRYLTPAGPAADASMVDWRDDLERLRAADPSATVTNALAALGAGEVVVVVWHPDAAPGANEWHRLEDGAMRRTADALRGSLVERSVIDIDGWRIETLERSN